MKRSLCKSGAGEKPSKVAKKEEGKFKVNWMHHGDEAKGLKPLMYLDGEDILPSAKIAGFDLDYTLIATQSGKAFPTGPADWKFLSGKVIPKLKSLREDGYKIVVFTNQAGLEKKKVKSSEIQTKISAIMSKLGFAFQVFVSTGENIYRKPYTSMWDFMIKKCNGCLEVDMNSSYYVGDAAGRPKGWAVGRKKDFSCSDRKFAVNVGLKFYTPEEFFDGAKPYKNFDWYGIDPTKVLTSANIDDSYENIASNDTELIVFVGVPASGKSTFHKNHLQPKNYVSVNRDTLKTQVKCLKVAMENIMNGKSVVVDNTNPSKEARKPYIEVAKKAGVPARCFHFQTPLDLAKHLNMYRQIETAGKTRRIPDVGYNVYKSKYEEPSVSEGFSKICKITFKPKFESEENKKLFEQWT